MNLLFTALAFAFILGCSPKHGDTDTSMPENPSLSFKIGQMIKAGFQGMSLDQSTHIQRDLEQYHLGSVVLFDYDVPSRTPVRNVESPEQLKMLISELNRHATSPLLVTIDQEGGRVARLKERQGFPASVTAARLGELDNPDSTKFHAHRTARTLRETGINVNLAPVVDLNLNPENPIIGAIGRSFSADPERVTQHARIFAQMHRQEGVLTTLKHFPGHGSSREDSHLGMVDVTDVWHPDELLPYRNLILSGDADVIMTAHIYHEEWDREWPATLSKRVITGMLREELGFDGVVISDDMQMDAIRSYYGLETAIEQAIHAGVDILSFANNSEYNPDIVPQAHEIIQKLVMEGRISEGRINESYQRIRRLKMERLP